MGLELGPLEYLWDRFTEKSIKYNLELVAVQAVKWVEGGCQPADGYTSYCGVRSDRTID